MSMVVSFTGGMKTR